MKSPSLVDLDALDLISQSASAAFAIDRQDRIIYWNEGATRLMGYTGDEVLGRFCFNTIAGIDAFGNRYCTKECPMVVAAAGGSEMEPYLIDVQTKKGDRRKFSVKPIALPSGGEHFSCLMHLIEPADSKEVDLLVETLRQLAGQPVKGDRPAPSPEPMISVSPLTTREREILELLSNGYAAINIAARLDLAHATVRNHIQNILRKMEVHSQVEAIAVAFRRGWLTARAA